MSDLDQVPADTSTEASATAEPSTTKQMSFTVLDNGQIRADFGSGHDPLFLDPGAVPEAIQIAAVTEGLISRTRGYTSKLAGDARTAQALREAVAKGFAALVAGVWKIERAAGATEFTVEAEAAFVFRQLRAAAKNETYDGTLEQVAADFGLLTEDQKKTLKALPRYQQALAQVKAARAAAKASKLAAKADAAEDDSAF